jgi:RimJ/RimL family protein N-acetyltransferase
MIDTERLVIKPLTPEQLRKYIMADNSLELELNLNPAARTISPELREALERDILPNLSDPCKNYLFYTLWTIILKEDNKIIGDLCFCGEPNADGEVEIGYGTYKEYRKRGLMTEAVGEMIKWAKKQSAIKAITASTEKSNIDSHSVLVRNNFTKSGESGTLNKWKLKIS